MEDKEKKRASHAKWVEENRDRLNEYNRKWLSERTEEQKEHRRQVRKAWREKNKDRVDEYDRRRRHNPKYREVNNKWRENNKDRINAEKRELRRTEHGKNQMRKYNIQGTGLTVEQYDAAVEKQNNKCAICGAEYTASKTGRCKRLSIDHHHDTMVFRGLLCHRCNTAVGLVKDDPVIAQNMAAYLLERNQVKEDTIILKRTPKNQDSRKRSDGQENPVSVS